MADSYFDKLGWKKELVNQTSFVGTTVQINNGSNEVAGQTVITVDGGTDSDIRNDIAVGDVLYWHVNANNVGGSGEWFLPTLMGTVLTTDSATQFTLSSGLVAQADDDGYIYKLTTDSGRLSTPVRTIDLYLDDADDGTVFYSPRFDWIVREDFSIAVNCMVVNKADLTLASSATLNDFEVVGSVNGTNWVKLEDFGELSINGACINKVYDIDAKGVLPYMALRTTGPSADQGAASDAGGILKIKIAVVPHG